MKTRNASQSTSSSIKSGRGKLPQTVKKIANKRLKLIHTINIVLLVLVVTVFAVRHLYGSHALSFTSETAKTANSFLNSEGVNIHPTGVFSDKTLVAQKAKALGVRWIRDNSSDTSDGPIVAAGLKLDLVTTTMSSSIPASVRDNIKSHYANNVMAVEGLNEVDMFQGNNFAGACSQQAQLYSTLKADAVTKNIPVMSFSIAGINLGTEGPAALKACPNIANISDVANIHAYPGGRTPELGLPDRYATAVADFGGKVNPVAITETGYDEAMQNTGGNKPITEAGDAVYMPRLYLFNFAYGVKYTSKYELADQGNDQTNQEMTFGYYHNNWTPKPSAIAIGNMNQILADTANFTPGSLSYTFSSGADSTLQHLLLQKGDGSYYMALWRNTSVWDRDTKTTLNPGSSPVTVAFPNAVNVTVYAPNTGTNPIQSTVSAASKTVSVGPTVVILKIGGGTVPPPPPSNPQPDLVVTSASPVSATAGSSITFTAIVKNQGTAATPAGTPITATFELDGKQVSISDKYTSSLAAGQTVTLTADAATTTPASGSHTLVVTADKANGIAESNETNNTLNTTFTSSTTSTGGGGTGTGGGTTGGSYPDLTVSVVKPSQADNGTPVIFSAIVKNIGSVATPSGTIIGVSFEIDGAHVSWSDSDTKSLLPGQSVTLTANNGPTGTRIWNAVAGSHQLSAWVDDINRIQEQDETNNRQTITMTVNP